MIGQDQCVVLTSSRAVTRQGVAMRVADRIPRTPITISHASSTDISAMLAGRVPSGSEKIRLTSNAAPTMVNTAHQARRRIDVTRIGIISA